MLALAPLSASAYQLFSQSTGGTGVSPNRWQSLTIPLTADNGPTDVLAEITTATTTWNDVATAKAVWSTPVKAVTGTGTAIDYTGANMGTAWGNLTGDGKHEFVFDEDGSALTALGLAPASVNGYGPSRSRVVGGVSVIDDMYLIVNGQRANFDRQATEIHELGHTLGLAHSSVGFYLNKPAALSPVTSNDVPTMHPYSVGGGMQRRTLEADDIASLSELYPESTFATTFGTISGTVTRCESNEPVLGVNVRAINVANPAIQMTRVTGFDGTTGGTYTIHGVPAGSYKILVEPLSGDADYLGRLAMYTRVDTDFKQEFHNISKEPDCSQDSDPNEQENVAVSAGASSTADFKVDPVALAFVVDTTGSMGPEIAAVRAALNTYITVVEALPGPFPNTALVTFKDSATINLVSRNPAALKTAVSGLFASGGGDCPEASNAALIAAGRLLARDGRAVLATDADSRADGPSRATVNALYTARGARLSTILSGNCAGEARASRGQSANGPGGGSLGEVLTPIDQLGSESSIKTFSEISRFTGGLFSYQPEVKSGDPDAAALYANTIANVAISAVTPAVAGANPTKLPRGTTVDIELTGSNTSFRPSSSLAIGGTGVSVISTSVLSPTRMIARLSAAAGATLGVRDVTVTSDPGTGPPEIAKGIGPFEVTEAPTSPTILGVSPSAGEVGSTLDVSISGGLTNFAAGTSTADFGANVTVNSLTVHSPTSATANVTVAPGAAVGFRNVTVTTGAETADESIPGPFLVVAAAPPVPALTAASPSSGEQGSTVDVTLTGANTAFVNGTTTTSVTGTGVTVLSTTVNSPTSAVARLQIDGAAALGFRDIIVTTGGENAALLDGFEVKPPRPRISIDDVTVSEGNAGSTPAAFKVSLSSPALSGGVTVQASTANGTATAGPDYVALSGATVTIAAGATSQTIAVSVNGDTADEPDERFVVKLSAATGGTIADDEGIGTITDDDAAVAPPPPPACKDVTRPKSAIGTGKKRRMSRAGIHLAGTASDAGCKPKSGKVASVGVAIAREVRARGKLRCKFLTAKGNFGKAQSCTKLVFRPAKGKTKWTLDRKMRLRPGHYRLVSRAVDASANKESTAKKSVVRKRVR